MDVERQFHMTGGIGNTSYAKNSFLQKRASDLVKHITMKAVQELYISTGPTSIGIADLGCSSGPNTLSVIKDIVESVEAIKCKTQRQSKLEFRIFLNDLPSNDFDSIFKALPDFRRELERGTKGGASVYIAGYPGSFYGRLFPNKSLHFVYSSYSLHWLSKIPEAIKDGQGRSLNKGSIYISKTSPQLVAQAYYKQFRDDFSLFLQSRSEEIVTGGRMVLILLGRAGSDHVDRGNSFFWELLTRCLENLVSQGVIDRDKLDSYDVHFYAPSRNEIEEEVRREGSFLLDQIETFGTQTKGAEREISYGTAVAMTVRAVQESMLSQHFGGKILDDLFWSYGRMVDEEMAKEEIQPITTVLVLTKL